MSETAQANVRVDHIISCIRALSHEMGTYERADMSAAAAIRAAAARRRRGARPADLLPAQHGLAQPGAPIADASVHDTAATSARSASGPVCPPIRFHFAFDACVVPAFPGVAYMPAVVPEDAAEALVDALIHATSTSRRPEPARDERGARGTVGEQWSAAGVRAAPPFRHDPHAPAPALLRTLHPLDGAALPPAVLALVSALIAAGALPTPADAADPTLGLLELTVCEYDSRTSSLVPPPRHLQPAAAATCGASTLPGVALGGAASGTQRELRRSTRQSQRSALSAQGQRAPAGLPADSASVTSAVLSLCSPCVVHLEAMRGAALGDTPSRGVQRRRLAQGATNGAEPLSNDARGARVGSTHVHLSPVPQSGAGAAGDSPACGVGADSCGRGGGGGDAPSAHSPRDVALALAAEPLALVHGGDSEARAIASASPAPSASKRLSNANGATRGASLRTFTSGSVPASASFGRSRGGPTAEPAVRSGSLLLEASSLLVLRGALAGRAGCAPGGGAQFVLGSFASDSDTPSESGPDAVANWPQLSDQRLGPRARGRRVTLTLIARA
ncbi:hypothetical protein KFE25_005433 [Diacronema lutheri]|uniref:Uncharacterized protein n=1 Tax=Diacronema lutheri TaxID=2081491 RepID=A0A8J6CFP5_DIALT|nr:hypothetical protein KFE25_005433 [Diacronema lutheri]